MEESLRIAAQLSKAKVEIDDLKLDAAEMRASVQKAKNSSNSLVRLQFTCDFAQRDIHLYAS
jgi:hypothetical protein